MVYLKGLFSAFILILCFATKADEAVVKQDVIYVSEGEQYEFPPGAAVLHVAFLTVEKNGIIKVGPNTTSAEIVVSELASFAEGGRIEIRGQDGKGAGRPGEKAASFTGLFSQMESDGLTVYSVGGDGAQGERGRQGSSAVRKSCSGGSGRPAGSGAPGGSGGPAGDGGDIRIEYSMPNENPVASLEVVSAPGQPGAGGPGGKGGAGAPSVSCLGYRRGGYGEGRTGGVGPKGAEGSSGKIEVLKIE